MGKDLDADTSIATDVLIWGGLVALAGLALLVIIVIWVRRRCLDGDNEGNVDVLNLATLDRLRDEGAIDEREYRALRATAVQALRASLDKE